MFFSWLKGSFSALWSDFSDQNVSPSGLGLVTLSAKQKVFCTPASGLSRLLVESVESVESRVQWVSPRLVSVLVGDFWISKMSKSGSKTSFCSLSLKSSAGKGGHLHCHFAASATGRSVRLGGRATELEAARYEANQKSMLLQEPYTYNLIDVGGSNHQSNKSHRSTREKPLCKTTGGRHQNTNTNKTSLQQPTECLY